MVFLLPVQGVFSFLAGQATGHHRIPVICPSLGGDAFCAGEMRRQQLSGSVQGRGRFVEDRVIGLEDVRHLGGDVEGDLDVGDGGLSR